ncbi:MAG: hypothetical protein ACREFT_19400 [Acetobacteraceae bacterium]
MLRDLRQEIKTARAERDRLIADIGGAAEQRVNVALARTVEEIIARMKVLVERRMRDANDLGAEVMRRLRAIADLEDPAAAREWISRDMGRQLREILAEQAAEVTEMQQSGQITDHAAASFFKPLI